MGDFLEPADGCFSAYNDKYYLRVRETLLADFSATPLAGLVVLPSFTPEYALWIGKGWRRHYAVYRVGKTSIWQALQQPSAAPVHFYTCNAKLPPELAQALEAVFWTVLSQARYSDNKYIMLDGTAYHFTAFRTGLGSRSGQTQSPDLSSNLGKLIALAESLIQQIIQPADKPNCWAELTEAAIALRAEFAGL